MRISNSCNRHSASLDCRRVLAIGTWYARELLPAPYHCCTTSLRLQLAACSQTLLCAIGTCASLVVVEAVVVVATVIMIKRHLRAARCHIVCWTSHGAAQCAYKNNCYGFAAVTTIATNTVTTDALTVIKCNTCHNNNKSSNHYEDLWREGSK